MFISMHERDIFFSLWGTKWERIGDERKIRRKEKKDDEEEEKKLSSFIENWKDMWMFLLLLFLISTLHLSD